MSDWRDGPPPAPSAALRALVDGAQPVTSRRPLQQLGQLLGAALILAALSIGVVGMRHDHDALPHAQFVLASIAWALALAIGASAALVPPSGQVLPSIERARVGLALVVGLALLAGVGLLGDAPGLTAHYAGAVAWQRTLHCARFGVLLAVPIVLFAWVLVLRRIPVGGAIVGAAVGAAAGALSGLVLHLICSVGGVEHVLFGHVAVVAIGAIMGALAARR